MIIQKAQLFPANLNKLYFMRILLLTLLYYITGKISLSIAQDESIITIVIFGAEGFALASVLLFGRSLWPGIFLGQFLLAMSTGIPVFSSGLVALTNVGEAILAVILFYHFGLHKRLSTLRDVIGLSLLIILILQPISAVFGTLSLCLTNTITCDIFFHSIFSWWFGNTMGQLLMTPLLLLLYANKNKLHYSEIAMIVFTFILLYYLLIDLILLKHIALIMTITLLLTLLLTIYRGTLYGLLATLTLSIAAVTHTHVIYSNDIAIVNQLIDTNFFILAHIILVLIIGTLFREREEAQERLQNIAHYDYLTGVPNRHLLEESIHESMQYAKKHQETSAVCFLDLDGFKEVNDTLGHEAGDEVLKRVVARIQALIHHRDVLIRLGGDEFVIVMQTLHQNKNLMTLLDRILKQVNRPIDLGEQCVQVSLSMGVAFYPDDASSCKQLLKEADKAMYVAKKEGKNRVVFYNKLKDPITS